MPPKKKVKAEAEPAATHAQAQPEPQAVPPEVLAEVVAPEPNVVRSSKFYFATGDVVLSAWDTEDRDSKPRTVFRVDKAFLSRHSSVLAAQLQSAPVPGTQRQLYDGVPLITLEDWRDDVEDLLSFMYNPACVIAILHNANNVADIQAEHL